MGAVSAPGRRGVAGRLRRMAATLTKSPQQIEREELRQDTDLHGGTPICDLADRQVAVVCGVVRTVTLPPQVSVPALVVELDDGSRQLQLVWLGRRAIGGIRPGTYLKARGRVCLLKTKATIFNPAYEIVPQ